MAVISGHVVDIHNRQIFPGKVYTEGTQVIRIEPTSEAVEDGFLLPGFTDAHIHIESSLLVPSAFAHLAVRQGTVATVSDPHEIANVCGIEGIRFMVSNSKTVPLKFHFGVPSCVPATGFETAGAAIGPQEVLQLMEWEDMHFLSEVMNYPGVLQRQADLMAKIEAAKEFNKPIDGHAPGLTGDDARDYFSYGITTDHECFTYEEGKFKASIGVKILIREGSAARNFEALIPLLREYPELIMFCSDDKHPDDLLQGHLNSLCARAVKAGYDLWDTLRAACLNPVQHYRLQVGLLREGDQADFIRVDNLEAFNVLETWIAGAQVFNRGYVAFNLPKVYPLNRFKSRKISVSALAAPVNGKVKAIVAADRQLVTEKALIGPFETENLESDLTHDLLKLTVVNRYKEAPPAIAWITGFGLKKGAIASTVAHDSHNIIAAGVEDQSLTKVINALMETRGGLAWTDGEQVEVLPLEVAGLMSLNPGETVAEVYSSFNASLAQMGATMPAPFMTLSFMALLVIPSLKLSDQGLFDGDKFRFTQPVSKEEL